jgi:hypothetical protein
MKKRRLLTAALWLAGLALLGWALSGLAWSETVQAIRRLDASAWVVLAGVNGAALVVFSLRWWVILRGLGRPVRLFPACAYRLAAFGLSYFTPGPQFGGEPLQVILVERREGIPRDVAVASVALDRLLELTVSFGFLAGALLYLVRPGPAVLLSLLPLVYLLALRAGRLPLSRVAAFDLVRESERTAARFCREHPRELLLSLAASLAGIAVMLVEYWLMAHFLGMTLSPRGLVLGLTAARVAYLLFFPAALGIFEAGQIAAVTALGFPPALGVSLSLLVRARDVVLGGLGLVWGLRAVSAGGMIRS